MVLSYWEKIKYLLFEPKHFFSSVRGENKYFPILLFVAIVYIIGGLLETIVSLPVNSALL